jgi:prepilin-type N-terminal cleavage/methylation domain-containing protein
MARYIRQNGFSLTEVLMATGILAMGLMLVAMAFPVGVKLVSVSTERTIADAAIGEAAAKMHLYGIKSFTDSSWGRPAADPNTTCTDYEKVCATTFPANERYYPSLVPLLDEDKRYCWSILARRTDPAGDAVQTTVLVCRIQGMNAKYYDMDAPPNNRDNLWPVPVKVTVKYTAFGKTITVEPNTQFNAGTETLTACRFFTEGCMIVEDKTGYLYKVMETQDVSPKDGFRETLVLNKDFPNNGVAGAGFPSSGTAYIWVVPPAVGSSRNPCIRVWQSDLTFP